MSARSLALLTMIVLQGASQVLGQRQPSRPPVPMEVAVAHDTPSTGRATVYVRNPGAEDVGEAVARVRWYSDALAMEPAAEANAKIGSVPAGATMAMNLSAPSGTYAQRVISVALFGVPSTFASFIPPSTPGTDTASEPPLPLSGTATPATIRKRVEAVYPAVARALKQEGEIRLSVTTTASGQVADVVILTPTVLLDDAAVTAVRQWEFNPHVLNGRTYALHTHVTIKFSASQR
jgi:TonB family protein